VGVLLRGYPAHGRFRGEGPSETPAGATWTPRPGAAPKAPASMFKACPARAGPSSTITGSHLDRRRGPLAAADQRWRIEPAFGMMFASCHQPSSARLPPSSLSRSHAADRARGRPPIRRLAVVDNLERLHSTHLRRHRTLLRVPRQSVLRSRVSRHRRNPGNPSSRLIKPVLACHPIVRGLVLRPTSKGTSPRTPGSGACITCPGGQFYRRRSWSGAIRRRWRRRLDGCRP
jgi:hypothetical protein